MQQYRDGSSLLLCFEMALNATKLQFCGPVFIAKMPLHFLEKEFSKIFIFKVNKLNISNLSIHEQRTIRFLHKNN